MFQVADRAEAGSYRVSSDTNGWSVLTCTAPVVAAIPALHLDGSNKLVQWTTSEGASMWKIVPTGKQTLIEDILTVAPEEVKMYDLQGRRLLQAPAQGIFITSDRKKHLNK